MDRHSDDTLRPWPILGRDPLIERAMAWFGASGDGSSPAGLLLVGPPGIGKSAVAESIGRRISDAGGDLERLVAGAAADTVPLLWLAPLSQPTGDARSRDALAAEVERTSRRRSPDTPLPVLVDDIHLLGADDLGLLVGLVRERVIFLVATSRPTTGGLDSLDRLRAEGGLVRIELDRLDDTVIVSAAEQYLGGPLDPASARRLVRASDGVPLFARELVMVNLAGGILRQIDGVWHLDDAAVVPASLLDLLADRYVGLDEPRRRVLEILAAAQPLPVEALGAVADHPIDELLADLEDLGLVTARDERGQLAVRLAHPLYADAVLSRCGPLRRRSLLARSQVALEHLSSDDPDRDLRIAVFGLEHGHPVDDDRRIAGATRALGQLDPELCLSLLADLAGTRWDATLLTGSALAVMGRVDEADAALRRAFDLADDDERRARTASRHASCLTSGGARHEDALTVIDGAADVISDPNWLAFLDADRAYVLLAIGRTDHARALGADLPGDASAGRTQANELLVGAVVAAMDGRSAATEELVAKGLALVHHLADDVPSARELLTLSRFIAAATAGRIADATAIVEVELERAGGVLGLEGPWLAGSALLHLLDGDLRRAIDIGDRAVAALEQVDVAGLWSMAAATRASALAQAGRTPEARTVLQAVDPAWRAETKTHVLTARAEAWALASAGAGRRAASQLAHAAQQALDARHAPFALIGAHDVARLGHPSLALPVLRRAAERCDGRLAGVMVEHAEALAARDPQRLLAVAEVLPAVGFTLSGAEAASAAADRLELERRSIDAVRARAFAGRLLDGLGPVSSPTLGRVHVLTGRERQIAVLAARRRRSREIAEELGISVRTVDNHLVTVYRKLGISGRHELAAHVDEFGS